MLKFGSTIRFISPKVFNSVKTFVPNSYSTLSLTKSVDTDSVETNIKEKWDILSAVCIERTPVISKELNEIEKKFQNLMDRIETENSLKSDFELKYQEEKIQLEKWKKTRTANDDTEEATIPSQDYIDKNTKELENFKPGSRVTEADKKNDTKSIDRQLDSFLLLVIKKKLGTKQYWHLPQGKNREDETLRETAERITKETFGDEFKVRIRSNAPCGFYKYKYPVTIRKEEDAPVGAKVFFYKAKYLQGEFDPKELDDYQWATRKELANLFTPQYHKNVSMFLIDEEKR